MTGKILTFYLEDALFGIDITLVKEISRNTDFTPVPGAKPHIVGLINMRGQVVTLFDLSRIIHYTLEGKNSLASSIILKSPPNDPNQSGFLISRLGDVVDVDETKCEPPPANVGGVDGEFIESVVKLKNELLIIINPENFFYS